MLLKFEDFNNYLLTNSSHQLTVLCMDISWKIYNYLSINFRVPNSIKVIDKIVNFAYHIGDRYADIYCVPTGEVQIFLENTHLINRLDTEYQLTNSSNRSLEQIKVSLKCFLGH